MNNIDIRKSWRDFMLSKGHTEVPNVSLIPQNDPTLLFVNSGMFPLVPYLSGQVTPPSKRLFNIQRVARFNGRDDDITEVGDSRHASFFHMIGNWSIGDYFKETQIPQIFEFFIEKLGIDINKLYVTVFEGDENAPRDEESIALWKEIFDKYGIKAELSKTKVEYSKESIKVFAPESWEAGTNPQEKIFMYPFKKNWWMRGDAVGELGGPDTEIFFDTGLSHDPRFGEKCHVNCDCGKFIEIGNNVFMQYIRNDKGGWDTLPQKNVDFGGGLERISMAVANTSDMFTIPDFYPIIKKLEELSGQKYLEASADGEVSQNAMNKKLFQIIADHMRSAVFVISDGAIPSNKDQGYPIRRLIRKAVRYSKLLNIKEIFVAEITKTIVSMFKDYYPHLSEKQDQIIEIIEAEERKFLNTLDKGLKELEKTLKNNKEKNTVISPEQIFNLYQTYGLPFDVTVEEVKRLMHEDLDLSFDEIETLEKVREYVKHHQELSRAGSEQKFKGGLADTSEKTTAFHSTAHLFLEAARRVLGDHVHQRGSNITSERIRFDFSHPQRLTDDEITKIEDIVNTQIDLELDRELKEYYTDEAFNLGAEGEFREKYGDRVNVYKFFQKYSEKKHGNLQRYSTGINEAIKKDPQVEDHFKDEYVFSFEICGGPHVQNTKEIKQYGKFKITKEESSSAGIRRIKAELV